MFILTKHPGKSQRCRRAADLLCDLPNCLGQMQIAFEVFALEPGMVTPPIVLGNRILRLEAFSEDAASQELSATNRMPKSQHVSRIMPSGSLAQSDYSVCRAAMG